MHGICIEVYSLLLYCVYQMYTIYIRGKSMCSIYLESGFSMSSTNGLFSTQASERSRFTRLLFSHAITFVIYLVYDKQMLHSQVHVAM
jgi:hypothetical protein